MTTILCEIMAEEGSDKSDIKNNHHNYTIEYHSRFNELRDNVENVFELGLGTNYTDIKSSMGSKGIPGASLRGWKKYFPKAKIYGADIDKRILFEEDKIKTYFVDQTNKDSIKNMWDNYDLKNIKFDIIIDDGLHEINANMMFFRQSFHKLKNTGIFVIEDVHIEMINNFKIALNMLKTEINFTYEIKNIEHNKNKIDNCLIFIKNNNKLL